MDKYIVSGGATLRGSVKISGAKNASVAILQATILAEGPCIIENVPNISDTDAIFNILTEIGATIRLIDRTTVQIDTTNVHTSVIPYEPAKSFRASYYFLGALLARFHEASVSMPGGCDLGVRPIDQHLKGFNALNVTTSVDHGMINARADKLIGDHIYLDVASVGATINIMMAASKAEGLTVIENAAKEPHIVDLANFLNSMGADIMGAGTDVIKIRGVSKMHPSDYSIIPDQIEAGTFMVAAAATRGDILIESITPKHLESITSKLRRIGVTVEEFDDSIRVYVEAGIDFQKSNVKTMPHPGFPTDMQPQITVLLTQAQGTSIVTEGIWDNRFKYVDELRRMGADISVDGKIAVVEGGGRLTGAPVRATDLRAGAAMIIAGLVAEGTTTIEDIYHIERGYEDVVQKFRNLGADIKRITVSGPSLKQAL